MLKINKSILIICLISLCLLVSQATAADTDVSQATATDTDSIDINSINENSNLNLDSLLIADDSDSKDCNDVSSDDSAETDSQEESPSTIKSDMNDLNQTNAISDYNQESSDAIDTSGIIMSDNDYSCGAAAFANVLKNMGKDISLDEARLATNTSENGTSMTGLIKASCQYNLSGIAVKINAESLRKNHIVHMNIEGAEHWSVVKEITKDHIRLADPTMGNVEYSLEEFKKYYTNNSLIIYNKQMNLSNLSNSNKKIESKLDKVSGKGYVYYVHRKLSYINAKPKGYAFDITIAHPKWGSKTRITTKKITSHMICCKVVYVVKYYTKSNKKGKATTINYCCIFNLAMKKGKTVTAYMPTSKAKSLTVSYSVSKFP